MSTIDQKKYEYSFGEEIANATSHGPMAALALLALPYVAVKAYIKGGVLDSIGVSVFVISVFLMFLDRLFITQCLREPDTNKFLKYWIIYLYMWLLQEHILLSHFQLLAVGKEY